MQCCVGPYVQSSECPAVCLAVRPYGHADDVFIAQRQAGWLGRIDRAGL